MTLKHIFLLWLVVTQNYQCPKYKIKTFNAKIKISIINQYFIIDLI